LLAAEQAMADPAMGRPKFGQPMAGSSHGLSAFPLFLRAAFPYQVVASRKEMLPEFVS
jgi:hypothetical protein